MELNSLLRRLGIEYMDRFYADLPESDRVLIDSVSRLAAEGNETALGLLKIIYEYGEAQAARLYYGAHAGDAYACLLLGMYHLHGKYVFARSTILAEEYLRRAAESPCQRIAAAAHRELACMNAPAADMELSGYTLVKYTGSAEHVVVPAMVKEIGSYAFRGHKTLRSVVLPGCVNHIGNMAFAGCGKLEKIGLPGDLRTIGEWAFMGCRMLAHISLPEGLETLGFSAFDCCDSLESVHIPGSVAVVGESAFSHTGLKEVWLHRGVRRIGDRAFESTPLERIYYEETLEEIGKGAFAGCDHLNAVYEYTGGYRIRRRMQIGRHNKPFTDESVRMWVMQEENRTLIITGDEAENGMLMKLDGMPSREDEVGYGFGDVGRIGGPLPFV